MTLPRLHDEYDAIVLGGGDNGLLCAAYLAKTGARTLLLERKRAWDIAGNLRTEEFQGPYRFNLLPPYMVTLGERAPCHTDLQLAEHSLAYVTPPVQLAFHHKDKKALVLHRDPVKSAASIAQFCAADATRFLSMYDEFKQLCEEILIPALYAHDGDAVTVALLDTTPLGQRLAALSAKTPLEIITSYGFESPPVREAMLYLATFWGLAPHQAGAGQLAVLWVYCLMNASLVRSGNLAAANAMYQCLLESGGHCPVDVRVARILVEDGSASGVELTSGKQIRARAVISNLDIEDTFLSLVGARKLSPDMTTACRDWEWEWQESSLLSCHFGYMGAAPTYHAAQFDPDVNDAYIHVFGVENCGDVEAIFRAIDHGAIPDGHGRAICATQFDEFHAGFAHVGGPLQTLRFEVPVPYRLRTGVWNTVRKSCQQSALEVWQHYANHVVDGVLSYSRVITPEDLERSLPSFKQGSFAGGKYSADRLGYQGVRSVCAVYRSPIKHLYMTGASTPSAGLIHFAAGYNVAALVAADLQLKRWWSEAPNVTNARRSGYLATLSGEVPR